MAIVNLLHSLLVHGDLSQILSGYPLERKEQFMGQFLIFEGAVGLSLPRKTKIHTGLWLVGLGM